MESTQQLNDTRIEIGRLIERILMSSHAIDKDSLCVIRGKLVWMVCINVEILSYDGNLIDPICMSILLSLKSIK